MSGVVHDRVDEPVVPPEVTHHGTVFWVTAVIGAAGIVWGVHGVYAHARDTRPANLAKFFLGDVIVHDAIWAPLVLAGGVVVARVVPTRLRAWVQAALIVAGSVALFAYPEIRDYGAASHNPTSLPYDYTANTLGVAAGVAVAIALVALANHIVRAQGRRRGVGRTVGGSIRR